MRLIVILFAAVLLRGQQLPAVAGTVTDAATRAPVPGARIIVSRPSAADLTATSDSSGAYTISGLRAGEYTVLFNAEDYVVLVKSVKVGTETIRLDAALTPAAALGGRVLDDAGRPLPGIAVELYRFHSPGKLQSEKTADDGQFRFRRVTPGAYAILARPASKPVDGRSLAPSWCPAGAARAEAQRIVVPAGAMLAGYDIRVKAVPVHSVMGVVADPTGNPLAGAKITLRPLDPFEPDEAAAVSAADGTFDFPAVRPGEWQLAALAPSGQGFAAVSVDKYDVDRAAIRVSPPFALDGFVDRDEPRDRAGKRLRTAVALQPVGGQGTRALSFHEQDGRIRFDKVQPGRYVIFPLGFIPGYYVDSVTLGDRDVFGKPVDLTAGAVPFRVVYKPNAGRVRGAVEKGAGATVVLLPQDETMLDGQFIRTAKCDADGRFEVGSLRPGPYDAFAFDRIDQDAFEDVAFVRSLKNSAVPVSVSTGQAATVDLKLTSWPE